MIPLLFIGHCVSIEHLELPSFFLSTSLGSDIRILFGVSAVMAVIDDSD